MNAELEVSVLCEMLANARKGGEAEGRTNERAAIVAWLQAVEDDGRGSTWQWADAIARGEHVVGHREKS